MAEIIDCTKCAFYNNGKCDNPNGMACNCANNTVCYFKELKRLEQENAELKAENEKLREDYIKLSQQKDLDNARWQKRCTDLHIKDKAKADKYWSVLLKIKEFCKKEIEYFDNNDNYGQQADWIALLQKITKVEEE